MKINKTIVLLISIMFILSASALFAQEAELQVPEQVPEQGAVEEAQQADTEAQQAEPEQAVAPQKLELIIIGPARSVLKMWNGPEVIIDPTGKYVVRDLNPGDTIIFTAECPGYYPQDYAIEMGSLSKTYRLSPEPTGVIAGELKFTDEYVAPGFGVELYLNPEDFYLSFDFYQTFLSFRDLFNPELPELSTRYIMPMLGAGFYLLPYDSAVRINLGASVGGLFGNGLPHPLFAAEASAGLEIKFLQHYIIFAEINPRLMMPVRGGWDSYSDIFGPSRAENLNALGSWALTGFPSTWIGFKYKY